MMKKMKRFLALALSCTMIFSLAGCGGTEKETKTETEATTEETEADDKLVNDGEYEECTIRLSWWGGEARHEVTQAAVNAFMEAYPGIKVETEFAAWTGWEDKMSTAFYAGTEPDVNQINWNWITAYSSDGSVFYDLNKASEIIDLSQFSDESLTECTVADKLQGIPVAMTGRIFYWNQTTFEKAGISVPTTMEELLNAGQIFKEKLGEDYYPLVLNEYDRMILMVYYLESVYGKNWVEDGEVNYTQEEIEKGLEFIKLLEEKHVTPTVMQIIGDGAESLDKNQKWMSGKYAGIFEWDSSANKFKGALEAGQTFTVGDYFKDMGDYQGGFAKVSLAFAISEKTEHPKEAAMLINFLMNEEAGVKAMGSERGVPLSKKALELCETNGLLDATVAEANGKVLDWASFTLDPMFEDAGLKGNPDGVYFDVMSGLSYGDYTVEDAAAELLDGINGVLSK
ncbi:ABC transporter substrate-binding protein [Anaerobium acetethylicum]